MGKEIDIYAEARRRIARTFNKDAEVEELKKKAARSRCQKSSKNYRDSHIEKVRAAARERYHRLHPNAKHYSKYKDEDDT